MFIVYQASEDSVGRPAAASVAGCGSDPPTWAGDLGRAYRWSWSCATAKVTHGKEE